MITTIEPSPKTTYAPLPTTIQRDGFTLEQVERNDYAAIYRQTKDAIEAYEVIRVKRLPKHEKYELPPREAYPTSEDWGDFGWTYRTIEQARAKFADLSIAKPKAPPFRTNWSTIGCDIVSAWHTTPKHVVVQTRDRKLAKTLSRIDGAKRLDAWSAPFLALFEFEKPLKWAIEWRKRNLEGVISKN